MLAALKKNIIEKKLLAAGDLVIVGTSGGRDSMALLHGLCCLKEEMGFFVAAAHLHHGIRGIEADRDLALVANFCKKAAIPFHCRRLDVPALAVGKNLESTARECRYHWFSQLATAYREEKSYREIKIATAHHLEDQGETVLLHLLRGSGTQGLGGMRFQNGNLIRPLLNVSRKQLEAHIARYQLPYRDDASNFSEDYQRNRIRLSLWPILETYNANLGAALGNVAEICQADADFIAVSAEEAICRLVTENDKGYYWERKAFSDLHLALRRQMVRILWRRAVTQKSPITADADETLTLTQQQTAAVLNLKTGKQFSLPRQVYAKAEKDKLYIGKLPAPGEDFLFSLKKNQKNK